MVYPGSFPFRFCFSLPRFRSEGGDKESGGGDGGGSGGRCSEGSRGSWEGVGGEGRQVGSACAAYLARGGADNTSRITGQLADEPGIHACARRQPVRLGLGRCGTRTTEDVGYRV
jgi:hypothetical protein